jgi:hypothetical protein
MNPKSISIAIATIVITLAACYFLSIQQSSVNASKPIVFTISDVKDLYVSINGENLINSRNIGQQCLPGNNEIILNGTFNHNSIAVLGVFENNFEPIWDFRSLGYMEESRIPKTFKIEFKANSATLINLGRFEKIAEFEDADKKAISSILQTHFANIHNTKSPPSLKPCSLILHFFITQPLNISL